MEPSKAARIRDFVMAAIILTAVGVFFVMAAIKAGVIGHHRSFSQAAQPSASDDNSVAPKQVQQYLAVYRAMQHDHSLTVEQSCRRQGLTVSAFRNIEGKIERNDQLRTRIREELQAKSNPPAKVKSASP
ncbi:MAG TPA: hypothetical protein VMV15_00390 [Candidatus Binataceae bacterium]|nr:hypothetical protein [Candidatus Binataceae bacterium]